jgi:tetratricopeptide (TPR) repeat protein
MHAQLDTIKGEVDALQTGFAEKRQPWYRQASVLIAVAALALSFTTTFYSEQRTREQDVRTARVELSQLIQRLTALPKENFELRQKYSTNPFAVTTLSGSLNSENIVLAKRAAEIIETLPSEKVSAVECYAVAQALNLAGLYDRTIRLLERGLRVADDATDLSTLLRTYGQLLFATNDLAGARAKYEEALHVFERFPTRVSHFVESSYAFTELTWAGSELGARQCPEANLHLLRAARRIARLSADTWGLNGLLTQTRKAASTCKPMS